MITKELQKEFLKWLVIKKPDLLMNLVFNAEDVKQTNEYKIGEMLEDNYLYVGEMRTEDGKQTYHLAVRNADEGEYTWYESIKKYGDKIPNYKELSLIFESGLFKTQYKFYWSSTEYSITLAWIQRFSDGYQSATSKLYNNWVRLVKRFDYSDI